MKEAVLKAGDKAFGFVVKNVVSLEDLRATLYLLTHEQTGAELIHFENDDDNNLFSVAFRTTPKNSTGVAHILEHTALCGSEKYPVKDPFFSMLKRSLNTFMNAFTANDWTMYPFSTQNKKDFSNLMDVYLDAAFFPKLDESSFCQEGWRVEFADQTDSNKNLLYKGVVYNEMKGAMSDPNSLMPRMIQKALYPTTTYHYNSGGDPKEIPNLSWQALRDFHSQYYHPSNARFFTYGDLNLTNHLKIINERVLKRFTRLKKDTSVGDELRFGSPRREEYTYPYDTFSTGEDLSKKAMITVSWLTCNLKKPFEVFTMNILSSLLLGNSAAPLYKALIDSGIGLALAPGTGYEDDNRDTSFSAGLQGVDPEDAGKIEDLIISTLKKLSEDRFSEQRIEAVIHQLEFANKEVVGDGFPYSLNILFRMFGTWVHDGDPVESLLINENIERLREKLKNDGYLEKKIKEYFLDNRHRVTVILKPDPDQSRREEEEMTDRLEELRMGLTSKEKEKIITDSINLKEKQEVEEDISCLPSLELSDIPKTKRDVIYESSMEDGIPVKWFDQPTNGISYFNAIVKVSDVPDDLKSYIPLFCSILTRIGAADYSYTEMAERIEAHTGGIGAGANVWEYLMDMDKHEEVVEFSAKALIRKQGEMFNILADIFNAPVFNDLERLHTLIGQIKTSMENSIPASGHSYARGLAARHLTQAGRIRESWSGVHQLQLIKEIAEKSEGELVSFSEKLERLRAYLLNKATLNANVVTEKRFFQDTKSAMKQFLNSLPESDVTSREEESIPASDEVEGWSANVPVSYVAHIYRTVPYTDEDSPRLQVLAKLLRSCYLHREIREKGGAYGGYATFSAAEGLFSFLSYRDPHLDRTLEVYKNSIAWVLKGEFSDDDLKEATLGVFADIDKPLSPAGKGNMEFVASLRGLTPEIRQKRRNDLLNIKRQSIIDVAEKYLNSDKFNNSIAVISGSERLKKVSGDLNMKMFKI